MKTQALGIMALVAALVAGCQQQEAPNEKQARLVAARNIELQEQLAARQVQTAALQQEYEEELRTRDEELAQCRARIETLQKDVEKGIAERVTGVTATLMNENARLRAEVESQQAESKRLRTGITRLEAEIERLTDECESLRGGNEKLKAETERLQAETERLSAELAELKSQPAPETAEEQP